MRMFLALLLSFGLVFCLSGCGEEIRGNGRIKSEDREIGSFNSIDVSGAFSVHMKQGAGKLAKVETDENLMQYIEVFTSGSKLVIRSKEGYNLEASKDILVYVEAPEFKSIDVSGSCDIISDGLISGDYDLDISASGSSKIDMEVDLPKISTHISGQGNIHLKGLAEDFDASISGSGDIKCFDLVTDNTNLDLSGSATAEVNVNKTLDVDVSGSGDVKYRGDATSVKKSISGAGSVTKVNN